MGQTATLLATALLQDPQLQVAHGFSQGQVVRWNGANWVLAQGDSEANSSQVGMVSGIADVDHFYVTQTGRVSGLTTAPVSPGGAYVPGTLYYLSPATAGALTATKPTTVGQVELPCYIAYSATNGYFFCGVGDLIVQPALFPWAFAPFSATMAVNNGYISSALGSINLLMPAAAALGDIIKIASGTSNGIVITQPAGVNITMVDAITTTGVAGTLTLGMTGGVLSGTLELLCYTSPTLWKVLNGTGIWTTA